MTRILQHMFVNSRINDAAQWNLVNNLFNRNGKSLHSNTTLGWKGSTITHRISKKFLMSILILLASKRCMHPLREASAPMVTRWTGSLDESSPLAMLFQTSAECPGGFTATLDAACSSADCTIIIFLEAPKLINRANFKAYN